MLQRLAKAYVVYKATVVAANGAVVLAKTVTEPVKNKAGEIKSRYDAINDKNNRINNIYEAINNDEIKIRINTYHPIVEA